jgi:hypothetical protein
MCIKTMLLQGVTLFSLLLRISACASQRPMLSSNEHLMRVGAEVGEWDIDECMARAEATSTESGNASKGNVVAGAGTGSVVGAAAGGAGGAIVGHAGQGAAAGAVGGVVGSLTYALLQGLFRSKPPQPSHQQLVDNCLRQKGYEPAGWK